MCSETYPKEFEKTTEVLPFTNYGLSSVQEYKEAEKDIQALECLKKAGLTNDEINLYMDNKAGLLEHRKKIEASVVKEKLDAIHSKINKLISEKDSSSDVDIQASTSYNNSTPSTNKIEMQPLTNYPDGHPMNNIKEIEQNLFSHLKNEDMLPITKRRKILRRLERKKDRILALENRIDIGIAQSTAKVDRLGSLWDVKEMPQKLPKAKPDMKPLIGPKKRTMYTVKDNKIVRLEPVSNEANEFKAVDIVTPVNNAEVNLLEGTKMSIDDIKKIERFKDYEPGIPSKTLYLKNIAPSVSEEQISLLFKQFTSTNGAPIEVRLMSGRMRGQAFVSFQSVDVAIKALEDTNGTILSGRPIIALFGRNTNKTTIHR